MSNSAQGASFGFGYLAATTSTAYARPLIFGLLKDVSLDFDLGALKTIEGTYRFPIMGGRGAGKLTGKASFQGLFSNTLGILNGVTPVTGSVVGVPGEVWTIPTTPYTVQVAQHTNWLADHGVIDLTTGLEMQPAASPAENAYTVTSGSYVFNSTDAGHIVSIAYPYTAAAVGVTTTILNGQQGLAPTVELTCFNSGPSTALPDHIFGFKLPYVAVTKITTAQKVGDWATHDISFEALAVAGTLAVQYTGE